jgi:hypothetical protein
MSSMSQARYDEIVLEAGEWLGEPVRQSLEVRDACRLRHVAAVYVATNIWGEVIYVGSARRARGVGSRIREHLRLGRKTGAWRMIWVIPLRAAATMEDVREVEARIGMRLLPTGNDRLPKARYNDAGPTRTPTRRDRARVASASRSA